MATIGVRELRRDASRWLSVARAGESVVVTDRGRPIARLIAYEPTEGYAALVEQGRIAPGSGRPLGEILRRIDEAVPPDEGPALSDLLAEMRALER